MGSWQPVALSLLFLLSNAFFVASEYALVSVRRSSVDALARQGNHGAKVVAFLLERLDRTLAAIQFGVTLSSIAIGAVTEPLLTSVIEPYLGFLPVGVVRVLSVLVVSLPLVVVGELVPKYLVLRSPERAALLSAPAVGLFRRAFTPIVWLYEVVARLILLPFGVDPSKTQASSVSREELALLVRAGQDDGALEKDHASLVARALRLDRLQCDDIMVHRLDIAWLEADTPHDQVLARLADIPHSRIPLCHGSLDEVVGILYVQDGIRASLAGEPLAQAARPAEFVPEALSLDRALQRMRESRTQILIVRDEYGGTAGLITLEDIVEEVFGELQDSLEHARPSIEMVSETRVSARADVRYDEILEFLSLESDPDDAYTTETLAEIVVDGLGRVPKLGDSVQTRLGKLRVENMARRRITRVGLLVGH